MYITIVIFYNKPCIVINVNSGSKIFRARANHFDTLAYHNRISFVFVDQPLDRCMSVYIEKVVQYFSGKLAF